MFDLPKPPFTNGLMAFYRATERVLHVGQLLEGMGNAGTAWGRERGLLKMGSMHGATGNMSGAWSTVRGVSATW